MDIEVGARVEYNNNLGYVRYAGQTSFAPGKWVGIELDLPRGKNAGVVEGKRYFDCKAGHGVFVRPNQAKNVTDGDAQVQRYFFSLLSVKETLGMTHMELTLAFLSGTRDTWSYLAASLHLKPGWTVQFTHEHPITTLFHACTSYPHSWLAHCLVKTFSSTCA